MTPVCTRNYPVAIVRLAATALLFALSCLQSSGTDSLLTGTIPPKPVFQEGFENATTVADLFPLNGSRWDGLQVQPTINEIAVTDEKSRTGSQSLLFAATANDAGASKADIFIDGLRIGEGDEAWFEWWVWLDGWELSESMFLWDLEAPGTCTDPVSCPARGAETICNSPGRRVFIGGGEERSICSDLGKWCTGDMIRQQPETAVPFPIQHWVRLRVHIVLSSQGDGRMQVWQNSARVLDAPGITLPRPDAVYTRMQIGITQNESSFVSHVIFVDDVSVWLENPGW